jgi:uroporphyrin-III C-methyltransferase
MAATGLLAALPAAPCAPQRRAAAALQLRALAAPVRRAALAARRRPAAASAEPGLSSASSSDPEPARWYQEDSSSTDDLLALLRARRASAAASSSSASADSEPSSDPAPPPCGRVFLVGTGPGDPGLLTLKAARAMQTADVVLYDRLVSEDILQLCSPAALMVYVGKQRSFHTRSQEEIQELLAAFAARAGATVVRLKGGDPFVFGRGGEEAEFLAARGVAVHVVPGITAAAGICAELGLPLTHRGLATGFRVLTGHARAGGAAAAELGASTAAAAADAKTTLVVYMGLATLGALAAELVAGGLPPGTPAVAVERGTTPEQRCVWAPLEELPGEVAAAQLVSPTLLVIGEVVAVAPGWKKARAAGRALDAPRARALPLPVLPGVLPGAAQVEDAPAGWRML